MSGFFSVKTLASFRDECVKKISANEYCIRICMTGCRAYGAEDVKEALTREISVRGLKKMIEVRETGCQGFCAKAPVVSIDPMGIILSGSIPC